MEAYSFSVSTRYADLDTQKHVNSAFYEVYCREARFATLMNFGVSSEDLSDGKIKLIPRYSQIQFHQQQSFGTNLKIDTYINRNQNEIFWKQILFNTQSDYPICEQEIQTVIESPEPVNIVSNTNENAAFETLPEFGNTCKRSLSSFNIRHIDLDASLQVPVSNMWRLNEESRWRFMHEVGLSFHELKNKGYSLFWLNGHYEYGVPANVNDEILIYSYVCEIQGARVYICQDAVLKKTEEVVMRTKGEFITVAIEKSKPVRVPDFIRDSFQNYTET